MLAATGHMGGVSGQPSAKRTFPSSTGFLSLRRSTVNIYAAFDLPQGNSRLAGAEC